MKKIIVLLLCCIISLQAMENNIPNKEENVVLTEFISEFQQFNKEDQVAVTIALETMLFFYQKILKLSMNEDAQWCKVFKELLKESDELKALEQHYASETPAVAEFLKKHEQEVSKNVASSFEKINERVKEIAFSDRAIQDGDEWKQLSEEKQHNIMTEIIIKCKQPLKDMATRRLSLTSLCFKKTKEIVASGSPVSKKLTKKNKKYNQSWG